MPNKKISQLTEATTVADGDILPVVQGGVTKKVTKLNLLATLTSAIATKADASAVSSALALKADASAVTTSLATKLTASNNLSDLANAAIARSNLGLGTMATQNSNGYLPLTGGTLTALMTITIANNGGTKGLVINQNDATNNPIGLEVKSVSVANDKNAIQGELSGVVTSGYQGAVGGYISNTSSTNGHVFLASHNGSSGSGFRIWYGGSGSVHAFSSLHDNVNSLGSSFAAIHYGNSFNSGGMLTLDHRGNSKEIYSFQNVTNANLTSGGAYFVSKSTVNNGTTYSKSGKFIEIRGEISVSSGTVNDSQILFDVNQTNSNATGNAAQITQSGSGFGLYLLSANVGAKPLVVRAASGQTANLTEWQNSSGTTLLAVSSSGKIGVGTGSPNAILSLGTSLGDKLAIYDGGANQMYGFGLQSNVLQIYADTSTDRVGIGYGESAVFNESFTVKGSNVGIGNISPSAALHVKAGTSTANTAPIKLTAGTNLTTPENGAIEFDGSNLYVTIGGVRRTIQVA